jgi:hypothetical protein
VTASAVTTRQNLGFAAVLFVFGVVMIGTTLPTPNYPQYQAKFGFSGSTTTVLFAVSAAGVIAALIGVGQVLLFSFGLRALVGATTYDHRTEATSASVVVAYPTISFPAILAGFAAAVDGRESG